VLIKNRPLGLIAFVVLVVTGCAGLSWFIRNARDARRGSDPGFNPRVILLHGAGAAITFLLAALIVARV
jgi:hypothetical protein